MPSLRYSAVLLVLLLWTSSSTSSSLGTHDGGYDHWHKDKEYEKPKEECPPPPEYKEECPPPPEVHPPPYKEECPPPPYMKEECPPPPPPPCPPPTSPPPKCPPPPPPPSPPPPPPPQCPPPPPPPSPPPPTPSPPPPPPKVDCSKCTCNCEACPICEPPPPCPKPEKPSCDPCHKPEKPQKPEKPECPKCDPCHKPEKPEKPEYPEYPEHDCPKCKYDVEGLAEEDAELINSLLDVEYVLQGYYSNAASASFKDLTVKKLVSDFSVQSSKHVSALTELLSDKADKKPESLKLGKEVYSKIISSATGKRIEQFNPYSSANSVLLGASITAPVASALSTSMLSKLQGRGSQALVAGLSSALAAQNAAIDVLLQERGAEAIGKGVTVAEAVADLSKFQQKLSALGGEGSSNTTTFETSALQFSSGSSGFAARSPSQVKALLKELGFF